MSGLPSLHHVFRHPKALLPGAPRGILRDLDSWVAHRRCHEPVQLRPGPGTVIWPGHSEEIRSVPEPRSAHPDFPCSHRTWRVLVSGPTALYRLISCRVLGREGTVISSDNRVIESLTYADVEGGIDSHTIFRRRRFPKPVPLPGTYATITYPSSFAWYHWVSESLPRLQLLQSSLEGLDGLFIPSDVDPQLIESLEAMGVRREQLIPLAMDSHFQPQVLLAPRYCAGLNIPYWVPRFLQESIGLDLDIPLLNGHKIYISRADASKRRLLNEEQLVPILQRAGFKIIRLREHSFLQQVDLFHNAAWVIGPHGAGLVNVLYSRPGVQLIELTPCSSVGPGLFHSATTCAGGTYWWLPGQSQGGSATTPPVHQDFVMDPDRLAEALAYTGAE